MTLIFLVLLGLLITALFGPAAFIVIVVFVSIFFGKD